MTTVISRLYKDKKTAKSVVTALKKAGFPDATIDEMSAIDDANAMADRMIEARIDKDSAATYASEMKGENTLVVVRAPFTPFGAARAAMDIVDEKAAMKSAVGDNNVFVKDIPKRNLTVNVMTSHPLFLTDKREMSRNSGRASAIFGWRLLSKSPRRNSAMSGGRFMSRSFWPTPLLSRKKSKSSVYSGGRKFLTS